MESWIRIALITPTLERHIPNPCTAVAGEDVPTILVGCAPKTSP